jgi:hypothetical protein
MLGWDQGTGAAQEVDCFVWPRKHLRDRAKEQAYTVKEQKLLVVLDLTFGNLPHLSRRGPTFFKRRFLEDFEESLPVLVKTMFFYLEPFLRRSLSARMGVTPHLPISVPHVEKLADLPVLLLLPIFFSDKPSNNTRRTGKQRSAVLVELEIRRRHGATDDAALGHDYCCTSRMRVS